MIGPNRHGTPSSTCSLLIRHLYVAFEARGRGQTRARWVSLRVFPSAMACRKRPAAAQDQGKVAGLAKTSRKGQSRNNLARLASSPVGKSVRARIAKRTSSGVDARTAADLRALIHRAKGPRLPGPRGALVSCSTAARPALIRPARQQMQRI